MSSAGFILVVSSNAITVGEDGLGDGSLRISQIGISYGDVHFIVRPLTYSQYETYRNNLNASFVIRPPDLASTFPSRPGGATGWQCSQCRALTLTFAADFPHTLANILFIIFLLHLHLVGEDFSSVPQTYFASIASPVEIPGSSLAIDDSEPEFTEGYVLYVEVDESRLDPRDKDIIHVMNTLVLVTIQDDDRK